MLSFKKIPKILPLIFLLQVLPGAKNAWAEGATLAQAEFRTCNKLGNKCLQLKSEKVLTAAQAQIFSFKDAELTLTERGRKSKTEKIEHGYMDLDSHHLVSMTRNQNGLWIERTLNLETFQISTQVVR